MSLKFTEAIVPESALTYSSEQYALYDLDETLIGYSMIWDTPQFQGDWNFCEKIPDISYYMPEIEEYVICRNNNWLITDQSVAKIIMNSTILPTGGPMKFPTTPYYKLHVTDMGTVFFKSTDKVDLSLWPEVIDNVTTDSALVKRIYDGAVFYGLSDNLTKGEFVRYVIKYNIISGVPYEYVGKASIAFYKDYCSIQFIRGGDGGLNDLILSDDLTEMKEILYSEIEQSESNNIYYWEDEKANQSPNSWKDNKNSDCIKNAFSGTSYYATTDRWRTKPYGGTAKGTLTQDTPPMAINSHYATIMNPELTKYVWAKYGLSKDVDNGFVKADGASYRELIHDSDYTTLSSEVHFFVTSDDKEVTNANNLCHIVVYPTQQEDIEPEVVQIDTRYDFYSSDIPVDFHIIPVTNVGKTLYIRQMYGNIDNPTYTNPIAFVPVGNIISMKAVYDIPDDWSQDINLSLQCSYQGQAVKEKGEFISIVSSTSATAYPDNGIKKVGGQNYWFTKISDGIIGYETIYKWREYDMNYVIGQWKIYQPKNLWIKCRGDVDLNKLPQVKQLTTGNYKGTLFTRNKSNHLYLYTKNEDTFSTSIQYAPGRYVQYQNKKYKCVKLTIGAFNSDNWIEVPIGRTYTDQACTTYHRDKSNDVFEIRDMNDTPIGTFIYRNGIWQVYDEDDFIEVTTSKSYMLNLINRYNQENDTSGRHLNESYLDSNSLVSNNTITLNHSTGEWYATGKENTMPEIYTEYIVKGTKLSNGIYQYRYEIAEIPHYSDADLSINNSTYKEGNILYLYQGIVTDKKWYTDSDWINTAQNINQPKPPINQGYTYISEDIDRFGNNPEIGVPENWSRLSSGATSQLVLMFFDKYNTQPKIKNIVKSNNLDTYISNVNTKYELIDSITVPIYLKQSDAESGDTTKYTAFVDAIEVFGEWGKIGENYGYEVLQRTALAMEENLLKLGYNAIISQKDGLTLKAQLNSYLAGIMWIYYQDELQNLPRMITI